MQAVEGADELPAEDFEAVQAAAFGAAQVEIEGLPVRVRIPGVVPEHIEMRFPFVAAEAGADRVGQRPMQGVAAGDSEQSNRGVVDEVGKLIDIVIQQAIAGMEAQLALDLRDGWEVTKDDASHAL